MTAAIDRYAKIRSPQFEGAFAPAGRGQAKASVQAVERDTVIHALAPYKALLLPQQDDLREAAAATSRAILSVSNRHRLRRCVLVTARIRPGLAGMAAPSADRFATPLGDLAIDAPWRDRALTMAGVHIGDAAFAGDNPALEIILASCAHWLSHAALMPLIVGTCLAGHLEDAFHALWGGPETLVIAGGESSRGAIGVGETFQAVAAQLGLAQSRLPACAAEPDAQSSHDPIGWLTPGACR
jgi:AmmeMemoRadiSam system protein B